MDALTKALNYSRGVVSAARINAEKSPSSIGGVLSYATTPNVSQWQTNAKYRERYALFRGWLYSAINVLASEAASQPVHVGRLEKKDSKKQGGMSLEKRMKMTTSAHSKAVRQEVHLLEEHPILDSLENPNPIQGRWQFVYTFVANLNLTGWAFIVMDRNADGNLEFYSLPTTWIKPDHTKGPFAEFKIGNPRKPTVETQTLTRDQVAFAHLPNPSDLLSAMAPASAQIMSIRINDHIETSRERLFENGIFPSVILTMGSHPHPDVPAGVRPRLTAPQRRQVVGAIRKTWAAVGQYGTPAIVDGLIEKIEPLSMKANEMGWEKSEQSVKTSILSCLAVHPYILGDAIPIGGYAQVENIEKRFFKRVNSQLDMLSNVMTPLVNRQEETVDKLLVWWEKLESTNPALRQRILLEMRKNNDISQNEIRAEAGFAPDPDHNESLLSQRMAAEVNKLLTSLGNSSIERDQAVAFLTSLGLPTPIAEAIAGPVKKREPMEEATEELKNAIEELKKPIGSELDKMAKLIVDATKTHDIITPCLTSNPLI